MPRKRPEPASQNDRLRDHLEQIREQVDLTTASGRRKSCEIYLSENPDASPSALPAAHHSVLQKKAKEWGHDPKKYKANVRGKKKLVDPSLRARVKPTPSGVNADGAPGGDEPRDPNEPKRGRIANQNPAGAPGTTYTPRAAGAVLNCVYNVIRIPRPYADPLDGEDREALGEIWAPIFNRHLVGHPHAEIGIAVIATLGFFSSKIIDSDKKNRPRDGATPAEPEPEKNVQEAEPEPPQDAAIAKAREEAIKKYGAKVVDKGEEGSDF